MKARVLVGNIFDSQAQTLVNTVNCVGVMGKGLALEFKRRFPEMYADYVARCKGKTVKIGEPYLYRYPSGKWILNFPTKYHWRQPSRLEYITRGLQFVLEHYREWGITSIAFPPLGCGEGGLDWRVVGPTLYRELQKMDIPVELYVPYGTPHQELRPEFFGEQTPSPQPRIPAGWVALLQIIKRVEERFPHLQPGTFRDIAYFADARGIPTGLQFRWVEGELQVENLRTVIQRLVNNGLLVREKAGRKLLRLCPGKTFDDASRAWHDVLREWELPIQDVVELLLQLTDRQIEIAVFLLSAVQDAQKKAPHPLSTGDIVERLKKNPPLLLSALSGEEILVILKHLEDWHFLEVSASESEV